VSTRLQLVAGGAGAIAAFGVCFALAAPAGAATTPSPSTPPTVSTRTTAVLPTAPALPPGATVTTSPSPGSTTPPIGVPAGNAGIAHGASGASPTEIALLFAGGIVLAAGGIVLAGGTAVARRHP